MNSGSMSILLMHEIAIGILGLGISRFDTV
jgi:hypothetical protein